MGADVVLVEGVNAGLSAVLWFGEIGRTKLRHLIRKASEAGVGVYPVDSYYINKPKKSGLLLGYAALSPVQINDGITTLAGLIDAL